VTHPDPLPALRPSIPVIAQEFVDHDSELRVYYVDGEVLGFDVRKESPADLWLASDRVEVQQVDPPSSVVSATRCLTAGLGLRFGALDFLLRDGSPVFLEVNPDGDWRWAERKSATRQVTMAVARMLRRLHLGARDHRLPAGSRPAGSFNLLRFLSPGGPGPS
jgi:glutathione synthase/RimK-type ligase-like ATP-grasp enzyme